MCPRIAPSQLVRGWALPRRAPEEENWLSCTSESVYRHRADQKSLALIYCCRQNQQVFSSTHITMACSGGLDRGPRWLPVSRQLLVLTNLETLQEVRFQAVGTPDRRTVASLTPISAAIVRVLQWDFDTRRSPVKQEHNRSSFVLGVNVSELARNRKTNQT